MFVKQKYTAHPVHNRQYQDGRKNQFSEKYTPVFHFISRGVEGTS